MKKTSWNNNLPFNDIRYYGETLYATAKGTFFLLRDGGAASKFYCKAKRMCLRDNRMVSLTREQAILWCDEHNFTTFIDAK